MNTLKKIFSVILCVTMLLSLSVASFAADAEKSDDVKAGEIVSVWGCEDYVYSGEAGEKEITIKSGFAAGEDYFNEDTGEYENTEVVGKHCCRVTADKAGYYALLWESEKDVVFTAWVHKSDSDPEEGTFKDSVYIYDKNNRMCGVIFMMAEGEKEYAFINEGNDGEYTIHLEYLGSIENVESATDLIRGNGFDAYYDEEYDGIRMYPYFNVTFSEGQTEKIQVYAFSADSIDSEEINTEANIIRETFPVKIRLIDPDGIIESISFPDGFAPSSTEKWDGTLTDMTEPDYIIVTLTDGTVLNAENMENIILPNGRSYTASTQYDYGNEDGEIRTELTFTADIVIAQKVLTYTPKADSVTNTLKDIFSRYKSNFVFGMRLILNMREQTEAYEDWTRADGFGFVTSIYRMLINACSYYKIMGTHFVPFVIITGLIFAAPLIIAAAIVIAIILIVKHRRKKKA